MDRRVKRGETHSGSSSGDEALQLIKILLYERHDRSHDLNAKHKNKSAIVIEEQNRLDNFLVCHHSTYTFEQEQFRKLLRILLSKRILNTEWGQTAFPQHKLRVLRVVRVLSRDPQLQGLLMQKETLSGIASEFRIYANDYYSLKRTTQGHSFTSQILVELACLFKRIGEQKYQELVNLGILRSFIILLGAKEVDLILAVVATLLTLSTACIMQESNDNNNDKQQDTTVIVDEMIKSHSNIFEEMASYSLIDNLLPLLHSQPCRRLVMELLDVLLDKSQIQKEVQLLGGVSLLLNILSSNNINIQLSLLVVRCLGKLAIDKETSREIRYLNGITTLLSWIDEETISISKSFNKDENDIKDHSSEYVVALSTSICSTLTQISLDDEGAILIRKNNGVYKIGHLILIYFTLDYDSLGDDLIELQLYALRALRFLYSVERNRKIFKKLFPSDIFASFVDIGHYVHILDAYRPLLEDFYKLPWNQKATIISAFESIHDIAERKEVINGYTVLETLGRGAFGTVYQVSKKLKGMNYNADERYYAMKELPILDENMDENDVKSKVQEFCEEVEILSKLEHPNVVKYYTSFVLNSNLYLIMEFVDGGSLQDLITSLNEKKLKLSEDDIWSIFVQLVLGIYYLHSERHTVHRDLTPSNIMVGNNTSSSSSSNNNHHQDKLIGNYKYNIKITDFGLARQKNSTNSIMKSAVGTISYACPEIIMHEEYTEKADIWSLGCILYHMACLKPPFAGNNPLAVAQRVVKGQYEPLEEGVYSPLLYQTVRNLLTIDAKDRPSIDGVAHTMGPKLLQILSKTQLEKRQLNSELLFERELHKKEEDDFRRQRQAWRQQISKLRVRSASGILSRGGPLLLADNNNNHDDNNNKNSTEKHHDSPPKRRSLQGNSPQSFSTSAPLSLSSNNNTKTPSNNTNNPNISSNIINNSNVPNLHRSSTQPFPVSHHTVSLGLDRLQPISNPMEELLKQVHKIIFIDQLPPTIGNESKKRVVMRYKRHLFGSLGSDVDLDKSIIDLNNPISKLKEELKHLMHQSLDLVDVDFPMLNEALQDDNNIEYHHHSHHQQRLSPSKHNNNNNSNQGNSPHINTRIMRKTSFTYGYRYPSDRITYEQLSVMIEQLCQENGYYGHNNSNSSSSSASALITPLPPTSSSSSLSNTNPRRNIENKTRKTVRNSSAPNMAHRVTSQRSTHLFRNLSSPWNHNSSSSDGNNNNNKHNNNQHNEIPSNATFPTLSNRKTSSNSNNQYNNDIYPSPHARKPHLHSSTRNTATASPLICATPTEPIELKFSSVPFLADPLALTTSNNNNNCRPLSLPPQLQII